VTGRRRRECAPARRLALLALLGGLAAAGGAAASQAPEGGWVRFPEARTAPSALALRRGVDRARDAGTLRGRLYLPAAGPPAAGPSPAVVLLHDCRGIREYQHAWARRIAAWGYVALLVDSFHTRGAQDVCARYPRLGGWPEVGGRVFDAYAGLQYLAAREDVDAGRVAVLGWARDATLSSVLEDGAQALFEQRFRAAIAFYPDCRHTVRSRFVAPTLVLVGQLDDWARPLPCTRMAGAGQRGSAPVQVSVYPLAYHAFDDPAVGAHAFFKEAWNFNRQPARGAHLGYHEAAHENAVQRVKSFLESHLSGWPGSYADAFGGDADEVPGAWTVDPRDPGPDLPPAGRSLFDWLFTREAGGERVYDVPFPFERVLARIDRALGVAADAPSPLRINLIPLGRSLQRDAAAPEYFAYPRIVVAVDSEPDLARVERPLLLRDRLFLGYQERANVIEVISWNEAAGRFEFQLVRDYRPGGEPEVRYASRALCTSCHQNGAPIFAEAAWDESNSNRTIAARLREEQERFHGVAVYGSAVAAPAIDNATDRANLIPAVQRVWHEGCGGEAAHAPGCRAAMVTAMLQYRLSQETHFDRRTAGYRERLRGTLAREWAARWPEGLNLPSPDIPNREPVLVRNHIPAPLDPLRRRGPIERWTLADGVRIGNQTADQVGRIVAAHADMLTAADVRRLDRHLFARGVAGDAPRERLEAGCELRIVSLRGVRDEVRFRCPRSDAAGPAPTLQGRLLLRDGKLAGGRVDVLETPAGDIFTELDVGAGEVSTAAGSTTVRARLHHKDGRLHARLADGRALEWLQLGWTGDADARAGKLRLVVMDDFAPLADAVAALAARARRGAGGPLAAPRLRAPRLAAALHAELGLAPTRWCCEPAAPMPPARPEFDLDRLAAARGVADTGPLAVFRRRCAGCHRTDSRFPPNFLAGDGDEVRERLAHCAERIYFRLGMWDLDETARPKSPMPPSSALLQAATAPAQWARSAELERLRGHVAGLLQLERGRAPALDDYLSRGYGQMRECLPPATRLAGD